MLRPDELVAWKGFLQSAPDFAGEAILKWEGCDADPPDIVCTTSSGRRLGVELTKWIEHDQISSGKAREALEKSYLDVVASERESRPAKIGFVFLYPKAKRLRPGDRDRFREEFYGLIRHERIRDEREWQEPEGAPIDLTPAPCLSRYLEQIWLFPRERLEGPVSKWVLFEDVGGVYSPDWMVWAAADRIAAKIDNYEKRDVRGIHCLEELYLLCHYDDDTRLYNTPLGAAGFDYIGLARTIAGFVPIEQGVFQKIFLSNSHRSPRVIEIFPVFRA
jgi:hypothetical protein